MPLPVLFGVQEGTKEGWLKFDGSATLVACGSDASTDNLPTAGILTVDGYFRVPSGTSASTYTLMQKGTHNATGWKIFMDGNYRIGASIETDETKGVIGTDAGAFDDGVWHHYVFYYNDGDDRDLHVAIDGTWNESGQTTATGTYADENAANLYHGRIPNIAAQHWPGSLGWQRISDSDRFDGATPTNFTPPARIGPPAIDNDTVEQWNYTEGTGTALAASVDSGNNGTITLGAGRWG